MRAGRLAFRRVTTREELERWAREAPDYRTFLAAILPPRGDVGSSRNMVRLEITCRANGAWRRVRGTLVQ